MGKPDSFLFCRLHDMKAAFFDENTGDFQYVTLSLSLPPVLEEFTQKHPEFSKNDAVLAVCNLIGLDNDSRVVQYKKYADSYGGDLRAATEEILNRNDELDELLESNPNDTTIIYLLVFCLGICGNNSPDAMAAAHGLLNRVLDMEEQNSLDIDKNLTPWMTLAAFLGFEEAHDRAFGSPIIGNSPFYNKDRNGDPIKKENNFSNQSTTSSSRSTSSGGCYVATAVYGSYDCPQVWTLRRYRDYSLARYWYGRAFIHVYYAISPAIVRLFGSSKWFTKIWRMKLDKMVKTLNDEGFSSLPYTDAAW